MKLNKYGERVFALSLAINAVLLIVGAYWLVDHLNWMGDHYCFHSMLECYFPNK